MCLKAAVRRDRMRRNALRCGECFCKARCRMDLALNCGPSNVWAYLSNVSSGLRMERRSSGAFWVLWGSARASQRNARSSATSRLCWTGNAERGLRSKKAKRQGRSIVFVDESGLSERRGAGAHLGAKGRDSHHPISLRRKRLSPSSRRSMLTCRSL